MHDADEDVERDAGQPRVEGVAQMTAVLHAATKVEFVQRLEELLRFSLCCLARTMTAKEMRMTTKVRTLERLRRAKPLGWIDERAGTTSRPNASSRAAAAGREPEIHRGGPEFASWPSSLGSNP